jgi:PKD repeat protein
MDGQFVAMAGCEYTNNASGHTNVFNTIRRPVYVDYGYGYADHAPILASFYTWMVQHPEAVGQFNHPTWYGKNFNDWQYHGAADARMQMVEVGAGPGPNPVWSEEEYRLALDHAWRLGPTNNGDTHTDQWGIDNLGRSGIWATELSYNGVLEALQAIRLFATEDGNLEIYLRAGENWMGETIPNEGTLTLQVYVYDPDGESLVGLSLYTSAGQVVTSTVPGTNPFTWTVDLNTPGMMHYYFARAEQTDGDRAVTAPIWLWGNHVVINEFAVRGNEWIELYNPTMLPVDLSAWRLTSAIGGLDYVIPDGTTVPPDGYYTIAIEGNLLNNKGDVLRLYTPALEEQDHVGFGIRGGAPVHPLGTSSARVPNGFDRDDDAADWNFDISPTAGAGNDTALTALGSSLIINEVNSSPPPADDSLEFFNPTGMGIWLDGWSFSDGDSRGTFTTGYVPPGGWLVIDPQDYGMDLESTDVAYLFTPAGNRVDQIGWYGKPEEGTYQRICDGEGPHDGYDWPSSGGGATWQDWPASLGLGNCVPLAGLEAHSDGPTPLGGPTTLTATIAAGNSVRYSWAFGDGGLGSGPVVSHIYGDTGSYQALVTASNPVSQLTATTEIVVEEAITGLVATNDSPTLLGDPTTLTATVAAGTEVAYTWALGDGTSGSGATFTHSYMLAGLYTASVTASNRVSLWVTTTVVSVIEDCSPVHDLDFFWEPTTPIAGQVVTFTGTASGSTPMSFTWSFGNDTFGGGELVTHTYAQTGTYTVLVTATNCTTATTTAAHTVTIRPSCEPVEQAHFAWQPLTPTMGQGITFTASASGTSPITFTWSFGDGGTAVGSLATHSYAATGTYTVTVTATNCGGAGIVVTRERLVVQPPGYAVFLPLIRRGF